MTSLACSGVTMKRSGRPSASASMWILVVSSPRERPSAGSRAPFSGRSLLVDANDGAVDHQILVVPAGGQRIEHPLPPVGMAPATEASMHRLPLAVAFRRSHQCAPDRSTHRHPYTNKRLSDHERPGSATSRQQKGNPRPLRIAQLIPLARHHPLRASTRMPMNQSSHAWKS